MVLQSFLMLAVASKTVIALSTEQVLTAFPLNEPMQLTGDIKDFSENVMEFYTNSTHALTSMSVTIEPTSTMYLSMGLGNKMQNSDMIIAWIGSTDNAVLSHRTASGHVAPTSSSNPDTTAKYFMPIKNLCSPQIDGNGTTITFMRYLVVPDDYPSSSPYAQMNRKVTSYIWALKLVFINCFS